MAAGLPFTPTTMNQYNSLFHINLFPHSYIRLATSQSENSFLPFALHQFLAVLSLFTGVDRVQIREEGLLVFYTPTRLPL